MKNSIRWLAGAAAAATMAATAAPASAQYYDPYYDPYRRDSVSEVVSGVNAIAGAVIAATRGGYGRYYGPSYDYRTPYGYGGGLEAHAVNACGYEADRRIGRYGRSRVDVRDVRPVRYDRVRVLGAVDVGGWNRYDRGRVAFSCDVRADGRVTAFRTHNYRW